MQKRFLAFLVIHTFLSVPAQAESFRALVSGSIELSAENPDGASVELPYNGSVLIRLGRGARFFRGVELEFSAPQVWLRHRGSLAMILYADIDRVPSPGITDLSGRRIAYVPLPSRIRSVYQIPVRTAHGLRSGPYATVLAEVTLPSSFPVIFRLMPIDKGVSDELENMRFTLRARPVLSDEGAVRIIPRFPDQLRDRPFIVLIDDVVVENIAEERVLREGERSLVVLSDDYRNISRRFMVERGRVSDLIIDLQDPTPLIVFEGPENARIFLNDVPVARDGNPIPVEPGVYEAKFLVGDYTITRAITVQRGKTYKIALSVGIDIEETE